MVPFPGIFEPADEMVVEEDSVCLRGTGSTDHAEPNLENRKMAPAQNVGRGHCVSTEGTVAFRRRGNRWPPRW